MITTVECCGWEVVRLRSGRVEVDVLPGKGGDVLAVRWLPLDVDVLWSTPWGLRPKGALPSGGDSKAHWLENYPGGWQTIFPNGGDASAIGGVEQGFHGEASLVPWGWEPVVDGDRSSTIQMRTRLSRSPFELVRRISVTDAGLDVVETVRNVGGVGLDVMWSHHPAFGAPFVSGDSLIESGASWFEADDSRHGPHNDLAAGARSAWPHAAGRGGGSVDLSRVPGSDERLERFGYLGGFDRAWAAITNPVMGLRAELSWDGSTMPHAWLWVEAHATDDHPWFADAYVVAIEPATSYPGQGAAKARAASTLLRVEPGEERTAHTNLELTDLPDVGRPA